MKPQPLTGPGLTGKERITAAEFRRHWGLSPAGSDATPPVTTTAKPQIRIPAPRKMNKTEAAWLEQLQRRYHPAITTILYEPITLHIPSGRYTPDFMVHQHTTNYLEFWEVKGPHIHNSASIRAFKEAIVAFPMFTFKFAQKSKDGWKTT